MRCLSQIQLNSNNSPFRFNAKELDCLSREAVRFGKETGNYYYGARYGVYPEQSRRDPKWSIWLSVDPLAELMPEWSSYAYTFNNPVNFTDPTGMVPEGGSCDQPPCDDDVDLSKVQELDDVIVTGPGTKDRTWSSESGAWDYNNTPNQYQQDFPEFAGMSDAEMMDYWNNEYSSDYRQWTQNEEKKMRLGAFINRFKYLNDTGLLEYADIYLKAGIAGKLLGFSGSTGTLSSIGKDAGLQFVITGDVDMISAGANIDYSIKENELNRTFNGSKSLYHMAFDWGATYVPGVAKDMASPGNYLGPNGVKFTGSMFGILGSELLKNQ